MSGYVTAKLQKDRAPSARKGDFFFTRVCQGMSDEKNLGYVRYVRGQKNSDIPDIPEKKNTETNGLTSKIGTF